MLDIDRSDEILDGEFVNLDSRPAPSWCRYLAVHWSTRSAPRPVNLRRPVDRDRRPAPQTYRLRQASLAAQTAYGASQIRRPGTDSAPGKPSDQC
jgi:hypothetical protein